ncbi:MAG: zinc-binding dehydrogenase [Pseudomonadota bacterium]
MRGSIAFGLPDTGDLKPIVDRILPWEQVAEAHRAMEENRNIGKIVLQVG